VASSAKLLVEILVKADDAAKAFDGAGKGAGKFEGGIKKAAAGAAVALGAIGAFAMDAAKSASRTQQAFGGLDAVFGKNAGQVKDWANGAAGSMGLSASAYAEGAAKIGSQMKNLGLPMDQVTGKTQDLMMMAADLAATYGGTTADAVDALGAALRGEADPAERYGLALNKTAVNAKMAAEGTDKLTGKAKTQAQTNALLALATEQAGGAIGQFARESDTAAGSAEIAAANWENAKSALGTALLPVLTQAATALGKFAKFAQENSTVVQIMIGVIAALAVVILVLAAAQWVMNSALLAFPGTWIILAIIAIVVAFVILWNKCAAFRNFFIAIWDAIKVALSAVGSAAQAVAAWFVAAWTQVVSIFNIVKQAVIGVAMAVVSWLVNAWNTAKAVILAAVSAIIGVVRSIIGVVIAVALAILAPFRLAWALISALAQLAFQIIRIAVQFLAAVAIAVAQRIATSFINLWNNIKNVAAVAFAFVRKVVTAIVAPISAAIAAIRAAFTSAFNLIKTGAAIASGWVQAKFAAIAAPIVAVINRIKAAFSAAWSSIKSAASAAASFVRSKFAAIAAPILAVAARIKSGFTTALNGLKAVASGVGDALLAPFRGLQGMIESIIGAIGRLTDKLRSIKVPSIKIPGSNAASAQQASVASPMGLRSGVEPRLLGAGTRATGGSAAGGVVINVQGALDPEAVARQIERILSSARRRRSGVVLSQRAAGGAAA
jgi:phage-related protein